jgi:quercetin dioxygenase-like cupin family protein
MTVFSNFNSRERHQVWDGIQGRVITGERITMALVDLEPNAPVQEHSHHNEQLGFIVEGELTFTIGGETRTLRAGDTYSIPANVPHHAVTSSEGCVVIDVFSPVREDWEKLERHEPSPSAWRMGGS